MGLLDLFSKEKREERTRQKNIERALKKYAQSADRWKALEALAADGSDQALYGLLRRFGFVYDKTIEDEQEKDWVFDALVAKGKAALPATKRYLLAADSISWPLRVLSKIATRDEELAALEEVLARQEPGYERDPTKKIQLMNHLGGGKLDRAAALVAPYLKDMDEGVRYAAAEALLALRDEAVGKTPLLDLFANDAEESLRIRLMICEGLCSLTWAVGDARPGVEKHLPPAWALDREGRFVSAVEAASQASRKRG
jgi:HEAT repeat protein